MKFATKRNLQIYIWIIWSPYSFQDININSLIKRLLSLKHLRALNHQVSFDIRWETRILNFFDAFLEEEFCSVLYKSGQYQTYQIFGQGMKDALSYTKLEITAVFFCNQQAKMVGISKFVEDKTFLCNIMT